MVLVGPGRTVEDLECSYGLVSVLGLALGFGLGLGLGLGLRLGLLFGLGLELMSDLALGLGLALPGELHRASSGRLGLAVFLGLGLG